MSKEKCMDILERVIYPVVDEVKDTIESGDRLIKSPTTPLFGSNAILDSLGLVTFIVAVEERIEKETGCSITLADEQAMSRKESPFRTMGSLAAYIAQLLEKSPR